MKLFFSDQTHRNVSNLSNYYIYVPISKLLNSHTTIVVKRYFQKPNNVYIPKRQLRTVFALTFSKY